MRRLAVLAALAWLCAAPAFAFPPNLALILTPAPAAAIAGFTGWSPSTLGSAVKAWWSAADLSATPVATWTDNKSSIAVTAAGSVQPAWSATGFARPAGGKRAGVSCDGVDDALVTTTLTGLPAGSTAGEIWMLFDQQTVSFAAALVPFRYGGVGASVSRGFQRGTAGGGQFAVNDGAATSGVSITTAYAQFLGAVVIGGAYSSTAISGQINGREATTAYSSLATGTTRLRICANNGTSAANFDQAVVSDVIVTTALTAAQEKQLAGWLAWRGGMQMKLPYNHPFRFRQP